MFPYVAVGCAQNGKRNERNKQENISIYRTHPVSRVKPTLYNTKIYFRDIQGVQKWYTDVWNGFVRTSFWGILCFEWISGYHRQKSEMVCWMDERGLRFTAEEEFILFCFFDSTSRLALVTIELPLQCSKTFCLGIKWQKLILHRTVLSVRHTSLWHRCIINHWNVITFYKSYFKYFDTRMSCDLSFDDQCRLCWWRHSLIVIKAYVVLWT